MRYLATIFCACALVAACGTSQQPGFDGGSEGGVIPDGGGVCCPILGTPPCGCAGGGGWAPSSGQCPNTGGACDQWFDVVADSHGCPSLVASQKCCNCPPPSDAGKDVGSSDAPID